MKTELNNSLPTKTNSPTAKVTLKVGSDRLDFSLIEKIVFQEGHNIKLEWAQMDRARATHQQMKQAIENRETIYGVTTGFGDSSRRQISPEKIQQLQKNLISYSLCGVGTPLPREVSKAIVIFRLHSLARGFSAVSPELLERMKWMVENEITPIIPSQGSLGASGDLIPLAYLAQAVCGEGPVWWKGQVTSMSHVCQAFDLKPYTLKAKEGLALVNGTSAMAAFAFYNTKIIRFLVEASLPATSMSCMGLHGRTDAFEPLVNSVAKNFSGQGLAAAMILKNLREENYSSPSLNKVGETNNELDSSIQDKYSIRCAPQILGPILDTLKMVEQWTQQEAFGVSDNPIMAEDGSLAMGGNFYGGYMSHGMDYLKISLAHLADMIDRQFMYLIDEKSGRGLPPNLTFWDKLPKEDRFLHHGLKGLNQAMSAITSEVIAKAHPGGIHSRSSEAHNQDKVSLGLSTAMQCHSMFDDLFNLLAIHFIGISQAIDIRGIQLKSSQHLLYYNLVRKHVPVVIEDRPLDQGILAVKLTLKQMALSHGH